MSRYNLIEEKWIPVRFLNGNRDELGIQDTLLRSKEIAGIEDPSPLVVAALHRFLLAILYRALEGPTDIDQAKALFKNGLPSEKIVAYLKKWKDENRFWLFDENYPFGQVPTFKPKTWRAWTTLAAEHNADTAKVLFDHIDVTKFGKIRPAFAIKWLLATQTFAVSAGKSEISHTGTAPSAGSMMAIPIGANLMDTFIFCLVPQNREIMQDDVPLWERDPDTLEYLKTASKVLDRKTGKEKNRTIERSAKGIVDLYTWRTCSVIFKPSDDDGISELGYASGVGYKESTVIDPMLGYAIVETKDNIKKKVTIHFEEKGFWRDFDSLLPDEAELAPRVIDHSVTLAKKDNTRIPKGVMILGQRYFPPRPNIAFWRREYFALPEAVIGVKSIRQDIRNILIVAEKTGDVLNDACEAYAKDILRHGDRDVEYKDIVNFVDQLAAPANYWANLEARFHQTLSAFTLEADSEDIHCQWLNFVRDALRTAWGQHSASVANSDAWAIRALVIAEKIVRNKLNELNEEIVKLEPRKEVL